MIINSVINALTAIDIASAKLRAFTAPNEIIIWITKKILNVNTNTPCKSLGSLVKELYNWGVSATGFK